MQRIQDGDEYTAENFPSSEIQLFSPSNTQVTFDVMNAQIYLGKV